MATLTIAQALATTATGLTVADTAINIAAALPNPSLASRVSLFQLNADCYSTAAQAELLAGLGSQFSADGYRYTIADSIADLTNPVYAAGLAVASVVVVYDTIDNILASGFPPSLRNLGWVISSSATISVADLLKLESGPPMEIVAGQSITIADTGANLFVAAAAAEHPSWVGTYELSTSVAATGSTLLALMAMPNFTIGAGVTLTITDSVTGVAAPAVLAALASLSARPGLAVVVSDNWTNLAWAVPDLKTLVAEIPATSTVLTATAYVSVAQLEAVGPQLPHFTIAAGQRLILADTVANLLIIPLGAANIATETHLETSANVTVAQLDVLTTLRNFSPGPGISLIVVDTSAHIATLTPTQLAEVTGVSPTDASSVATDTVAHLVAAGSVASGIIQINAQLDDNTYTMAQAAVLAGLTTHGATLTLVPEPHASRLLIADTTQNIAEGSATIAALMADGAVSVSITDTGAILSAADAAAFASMQLFAPWNYGIGVADTGSAIMALTPEIFGQGFVSITVTGGVFAGTVAELLDPSLHFGNPPNGFQVSGDIGTQPSARLSVDSTVSAAQAVGLALLPGFSVAPGVTLTVQDTMSHLVAAASSVEQVATVVAVTDSETITASAAAQLAAIKATVGPTHFNLGSNLLTVSDLAVNLTASANAAGISLANSVTLSANSVATAAQTEALVALGGKFSGGGYSLIVVDTAANLAALAGVPGALTAINTLASQEVLTADATVSAATVQTLLLMTGFSAGSHHLTISDTAADLLAISAHATLAVASAVQLSQAATVTVANAVALAAMPGFSAGGFTLTIADTPAHLAALPSTVAALAGSETLVASNLGNVGDYTITAAQLTALLALPNLSASGFTGTIIVSDTAADLAGIASLFSSVPPGSILSDIVISLSADATVTATAASALASLPGFGLSGHSLTISDSAGNLALMSGSTAALASSVLLQGPSIVSVGQFDALRALTGFSDNGYALTISDTAGNLLTLAGTDLSLATNTVLTTAAHLNAAQAEALSTLPNLLTGRGAVTVADTAANLLHITGSGTQPDDWDGELLAQTVRLTATATVTAAQAVQLALLGFRFGNGGFTLTVQDTPTALLASSSSIQQLAGQISATVLAANDSPWAMTIAQAQQLAALPHFSAGSAGEIIADTPTDILLASSAAAVAAATAVTLNGTATVTVAIAEALHALSNFSVGSNQLSIDDAAAHLAILDGPTAAMANAIQLQGNGIVTVVQFQVIRSLPNYIDNGNLLVVADTAANLAILSGTDVSLLSQIMLNSNATVTATQAETLATLANFTTGIAHLSIQDTAPDLLHVSGSGTTPDDWAGELVASSVTLTANATVTAAQATELAMLGSRFSLGGFTLTISDTAADLLAPANAAGLALAGSVTLSGAQTVSAMMATELAGLAGFTVGDNTLIVSDTAANLEFAGYSVGLALAGQVQLNAATTLTVAGAEALVAVPGFQSNVDAPVTIVDTFDNLLTLASDSNSALQPMPIELSANATATVAQLGVLAALPQYPGFSLNGHSLTVVDTAQHIAAYTTDGIAVPTGYRLSGDGTVTAAQANVLAADHVNLNGNALIIADTASDLLSVSSAAGLAIATAEALSGAATVTAAQLSALEALPNFTTAGHPVTVQDTIPALLGLSGNQLQAVAELKLADTEAVNAAMLADLAQFGNHFSLAGNSLNVIDTADALSGLDARELALTVVQMLSQNATVTAAEATELAALPHLALGAYTLTVSDTAANLLDPAYAPGLALASAVELSTPATVTVGQAVGLANLANFVANGADPIIIVDTLDSLLRVGSEPGSAALDATPIGLSENATVTVAQLAALAALPQYDLSGNPFSLNGHTLTLVDTGANLAAYTPDGVVTPTAYVMTDNSTLTAAQADLLANDGVNLNGYSLTMADTPAALLDAADNAAGLSIATALTLSGNATVDAADAVALVDNPLFSTGGFQLTVADSAENLLALPGSVQQTATLLQLAAPETVTAAVLIGLTELGIKFSEGGNALTVADSAPALAALNSLELALVSQTELNASGTVDAATANALAALPNLVFDVGANLTVQDSVANLLGLSPAAATIATAEQLAPGSTVTITAAQGDGLAALGEFSAVGSTITVSDTLSDYDAADGAWQAVATSYQIVDTVNNLLMTDDSGLLAGATSVTLASDAVVDAATAALLAGLPNFSDGTAVLRVVDTPSSIAANAAAIQVVATFVLIDASTPISAAQAEALVPLNNAGELGFIGSNVIVIVDNYADLSAPENADGLGIASTVTVLDTADNLLAAIGNDWGGIAPYYELSAGATVTGVQAALFAGLGAHFLVNGQDLLVADTAAAVAGNASSITALGIHAAVTDTATAVDVNINALVDLGGLLQSVYLTDTNPISAATAAGLDPIVSVWTGPQLAVSDTADAVTANLIYLELLGTHLSSVMVEDTAANVAAATTGVGALQALGGVLTITLTDVSPVSAAAAAGLLPVLPNLMPGTLVNVSDTATALAAEAATLAELGSVLGIIDVSDSTTTTALIAAAMVPIEFNLSDGVSFQVVDSAAAIAAVAGNLIQLRADSHLGSVVADDQSVSSIVAYGGTLASLGATATISDTAAAVNANLDALEPFSGVGGVLQSIALTDSVTPNLTVMAGQLTADTDVLALIASPYHIVVDDSSADVLADLTGGSSGIIAYLSRISSIELNDITTPTLSLTVAELGANASVLSLITPAYLLDITDSAANVGNDLAQGSTSVILAHLDGISAMTLTAASSIVLTEAQAVYTGVSTVLGLITNLSGLLVTEVTVAQIGTVLDLGISGTSLYIVDTTTSVQADLTSGGPVLVADANVINSITLTGDSDTLTLTVAQIATDASALALILTYGLAVSDSATNVQADLAEASPVLVAHNAAISGITLSDDTTITLTESEAAASGVADVLALIGNLTVLDVTAVTVAEIGAVLALGITGTSLEVADTATNIQADLAGAAPVLVGHNAAISGITLTGETTTITLTDAQATAAPDIAAALLKISNLTAFDVTDVAVAEIAAVADMDVPHTSIAVSDSAAGVSVDLGLGSTSAILGNITQISGITLTETTTITLTDGQALYSGISAALLKITNLTEVDVIGVPVADVANIAAVSGLTSMGVTDTLADVQADLTGASPDLVTYADKISGIVLTDGNTLTLTIAEITTDAPALALIGDYVVMLADTATNVQNDLALGASSVILSHSGVIDGVILPPISTITLTESEAVYDGVASALRLVTNLTDFTVTDVAVSQIGSVWDLHIPNTHMAIGDSASDVQNDLALGDTSIILGYLPLISGITLPDGSTITLTEEQATVAGVSAALAITTGLATVAVTGVTVAEIAAVAALHVANTAMVISDTAGAVQDDLALGASSAIVSNLPAIGSLALPAASTITLTETQAVYPGVGAALNASTNLAAFVVTGMTVAEVTAVAALDVVNTEMVITDTAGNVQADLTSGSSVLVHNAGIIDSLTLSGTPLIIYLTEAQTIAAQFVLQLLTSEIALHVTGVTVDQINAVVALNIDQTLLQIADSASAVQNDLALGATSAILGVSHSINSITLTGGSTTITLTEAQATHAGVAGVLSAIDGLTSFVVTDVALTQVATVQALDVPGMTMTISDSAAAVQADLALGASSVIVTNSGQISGIDLSGGNTITLTETEAIVAGVAAALNETTGLTTFAVTGVTVGQIAAVAGLAVTGMTMAVSDTATNVQNDLALGASSEILHNFSAIGSLGLTSASTITLNEAQAVYADVAAALIEAINLTGFEVTGVTVDQIGIVLGLDVPNTSIAISDTAQAVQDDLALGETSTILANYDHIAAIALPTNSTITLTEAEAVYSGVATGLIGATNLATFAVTGVSLAEIPAVLTLGVSNTSMEISDTAAAVQADLIAGGSSAILTHLGSISTIDLPANSILTLTEAQAVAAGATALDKITGLATFDVTGVTVAQLGTVMALGVAHTMMSVSDTFQNINDDVTGGSSALVADAAHISGITLTGGDTLTLSVAQIAADTSVLALIGSYHIAVSDTFAAIDADLTSSTSTIIASMPNISGITWSDGGIQDITLTVAQLAADSGVFPLIDSGYNLIVADTAANVQADLTSESSSLLANPVGSITLTDGGTPTITLNIAQAAAFTGLAQYSSTFDLAISDTALDLQNDLAAGPDSQLLNYVNLVRPITSIALPAGSTITLTEAQAVYAGIDDSGSSVLAASVTGLTSFIITGVAVADISTALHLQLPPTEIRITDSIANIVGDLTGTDTIGANSAVITSVTPTDSSANVSDATTIYDGLPEGVTFNESSLTISDTAASLLTAEADVLSAAEGVTLSANASGLTAAQATALSAILGGTLGGKTLQIVDTAANLLDSNNADGVSLATDVELSAGLISSASYITQLAGVHDFHANGQTIQINDTLANLLDPDYLAGIAIATQVTLSADTTVTAAQLVALSELHSYSAGLQHLTVQDTASAIAALSPSELAFTYLASVSDTSANVAAALSGLELAAVAHGDLSIVLTDGVTNVPSITVTAATYSADQGAIDAITTAGSVKVTGDAADLSAIASALSGDVVVAEVDVTDTAANILANLTALDSIGSKFKQATITDTSVNAAEVAALLTIPNLVATNLTIIDTGSQLAAAIEANGAAGLTFMNSTTVELSGNSIIAASDAVALEQLTSLNKNDHSLVVWDTASHLTDSVDGYLAAVSNGIIDHVYLKTTSGSATITAAVAASLLSISGFIKDNPPILLGGDGATNTLTVSDTAAHIDANFTALHAHVSSLSGIVVSGNATITDAVFGDLLSLDATTSASLTVRDSAATIYAAAPGQLGGSLTAAAWQLSASATVSEAAAAYLGGLSGFSAGAYTLTLTGSATISVSDADALGNLGAAFKLGGNHLYVDGSVATVTSMSVAAKLIVTPDITDTFSNVAALSSSSGVLGGTITVNDSEAVTYTQVENFLALLKPDNTSGAAVANVSFGGHTETVTDTLADIESLTGYSLWTDHVSMQSNFALVVADTVANLINPSNTAVLETMSGTTLSGDQSTTAANAESLFALESTINFSLGSHQITILDTAANILNQVNSDGDALASAWQLSSNATVDTADAETLLTATKFATNGHSLTVSDTSANLLDGILPGDINSSANHASVVVELSHSETLDAQTAEALVSLPGFTNNGDLSIADGSSYLLNAANHTAETDATSVTLAGNETVSVATAVSLANLPHFTLGSNVLSLASADYANAAALKVIADFGTGFNHNGFSLTQTQDDVSLTPTEYTALGSDNVLQNGHALSAMPATAAVSSSGGDVSITATGVSGGTLNVYAADGSSLSSSALGSSSISVTQAEAGAGGAVVITETMAGHTAAAGESAPIIALDQTVVTTDAGAATFATSGQVQVGSSSNYMNVYTAGSQPTQAAPELVYDANAHTLSLDVNGAMTVLVTLGTATHPTSLDPSEIFITHFA
jgi:hypothetical protein